MIRKVLCFLMVSFTVACGNSDCAVASVGRWTPFGDPYGDGGTNPAARTTGRVTTCSGDPGMTVKLTISGTEPNRMYGAHVHLLPCDVGAGGHYRNQADGGATATNEVWLDFMSDEKGAGAALATTSWQIPAGEARSVVIHDHATGAGGAAGAKLTCINVGF